VDPRGLKQQRVKAHFGFRGRTLDLEASSEILAFADEAFGAMRREPAAATDHFARVVQNGATAVVFDGHETATQARNDWEAAFYATRDVFALFASLDPGAWAIYGAAVELAGKAVVLLGPSGAGKTILTLHLVARGAQLYGDETFIVDRPGGKVEGMPRHLLLRESSLRFFPNERMRKVCQNSPRAVATKHGRLWYAIDPEQLFARDVSAKPARIGAVLLIARQSGVTSIEDVHSKAGLMELTRRLYRRPADLAEIAALSECCGDVPTYRVSPDDPAIAARLVCERIAACG
jgi:hypothetical protein